MISCRAHPTWSGTCSAFLLCPRHPVLVISAGSARAIRQATSCTAHVPELHLGLCRIQLELVEDKLRELRLLTLDPREYDDKTVTLSQLDRVRQELLATAKGELKYVTFGKVRPGLHADAVQRHLILMQASNHSMHRHAVSAHAIPSILTMWMRGKSGAESDVLRKKGERKRKCRGTKTSLRVCMMQEIVRDVISFADVHENLTPHEDTFVSSPETSPHLQLPDASPEG